MLTVKNKNDNEAEIYISGDIVDDGEGDFLQGVWGAEHGYEFPANVRKQLDDVKGKDLTIYINSDGGSVPAGVAIANMIARHDGKTTAVVDGWCCSIATQIFFAAQKRKIPANAYLMIHKPTVEVSGNAYNLREYANTLDTIQKGLETTYKKASLENIAPDYIHDLVEQETWLTGEDAAIIFDVEVLEATQAVAKAGRKPQNFKNLPKDICFKVKEKPPDEQEKPVDKVVDSVDKSRVEIALALAKGVMAK